MIFGSELTLKTKFDIVPVPHLLLPCTVILPPTALTLKSTVILSVLAPVVIVAPEGNVQM